VNYGNQHLSNNLLRSLSRHPDRNLIREAVIVDNGFPDMGDARTVVDPTMVPFPVRFVQFHGQSYSGCINAAASECHSPVLLLSNNDVEWLPGHSISPVIDQVLQSPTVGIAGPQLVFPDGRWQRSAGAFPSLKEGLQTLCFFGVLHNRVATARFRRGVTPAPYDVDFVDGACVAVSRACFTALGGWDPAFEFYACDADFNWRAKQAGWRRVLVPQARVMHVRGASSSGVQKRVYAKRLFLAKRHMVERMHGRGIAACYDVLQRVAALEYAFVYRALDSLWPTQGSTRRAKAAHETVMAALENA
jgi:GT2 family glycosyltransferase